MVQHKMNYCRRCIYVRTFSGSSDPDYYRCVCPQLGIDPRTGDVKETYCTKIREGRVQELPQNEIKCSGYLRKLNVKDHFRSLLNDIFK